jgi:hypothetical protein
MKNWLRNKLLNFLHSQDSQDSYVCEKPMTTRISSQENDISFTVNVARGGLIVTVRNYDDKHDRHQYVNHIIHDDEDASKNIADIVSVELMKR